MAPQALVRDSSELGQVLYNSSLSFQNRPTALKPNQQGSLS